MSSQTRALALAFAAALGCTPSGPAPLTLERYDRKCATVFDCEAVYVGPVDCCSIPCANTALNLDAVTLLTTDIAEEVASKCQTEEPRCPAVPRCAPGGVDCVHGGCAYTPPAADGGAG
ncbi:MAG TPA: hypothetical protein VHK47_03380 [Polyangia bacterium]|jgi:hypothetical protein|nr:hypothetical protein [Polyangia bacterium]